MPAHTKGVNVGPAAEAIAAAGWRRVQQSEQPDRFEALTHEFADVLARGRDLPEPSLLTEDPLRIAAEVEARAGIRRLQANRHGAFCHCDACRLRVTTES
ncbi:hypothetical protein [Streptomyces sp. NPDC088847]|uniref:hypothetical protein n=1 Tax=Streptomyces sp. NPDC088847 TaxID=3365909 RepID=UPI0037F5348C